LRSPNRDELRRRLAPTRDSGVGSASNAVALQVGGAFGVAVFGSALSTRYQDRLTAALVDHHIPTAVRETILGSLGGALGVAKSVGGDTGVALARAARSAFMSGTALSLLVGSFVALAGSLLMIAWLLLRDETSPAAPPSDHHSDP
jgi:DHA2 family multidrug resistance protein-like MFS transporter